MVPKLIEPYNNSKCKSAEHSQCNGHSINFCAFNKKIQAKCLVAHGGIKQEQNRNFSLQVCNSPSYILVSQ